MVLKLRAVGTNVPTLLLLLYYVLLLRARQQPSRRNSWLVLHVSSTRLYVLINLYRMYTSKVHELGLFPCTFLLVRLTLQGWFLTDFATALAIVGLYLVMVAVGPKVMSGLSPIDSYPVRFVYNVVQVRKQLPY